MIQKPAAIERVAAPKVRRDGNAAQNERIDSILLRLEAIRNESNYGTYVVGVCGCDRRVGVSTLAGNMGLRAAEMSLGNVLLVDANLNNPKQASNFRLGDRNGLADVLSGRADTERALNNGMVDGFNVMPAGRRRSIQTVAMTPDLVGGLVNELKAEFDLIILDLPAVRNSARSLMLARVVDGMILVLDAQRTSARDANAAKETLTENGIPIIGTVLNRAKRTLPRWLDRLI